MMKEKVVNSVSGYVNGCWLRGVKLEGWKLTSKNGLVWLKNEEIGVRIRGKLENEAADVSIQVTIPSKSLSVPKFIPVITERDLERKKRMERIREVRHAGLLGADRAGTW